MNKRLISLFLCFLMLISVSATGCSVFGGGAETTAESGVTVDPDSGSAITLTMYIPCEKPVAEEDRLLVEEAINKITKSKFKTQINLYLPTVDEYYETIEGIMQARAYEQEQEELAKSELKKAIRAAKAEGVDSEVAISKFYDEHPEWVKYQETTADPDAEETAPETRLNELGMPEIKYPDERENQLDIIWLSGYDKLIEYIEADQLQRLDEELSSSSKKLKQYIYTGALDAVKTAGSGTYAIPNNTVIGEYTYLLLNKSLVDKYKYSPSDLTSVVKCADFLADVSKYEPDVLPVVGELPVTLTKYWSIDPDTLEVDHDKFNVIGHGISDMATLGSMFNFTGLFGTNAELANTSDYAKQLIAIRTYKDLGYITEDTSTTKEYAMRVVKGGGELVEVYGDDFYMNVIESPRAGYEDIFGNMLGVSTYTRSLKRSMEIITYLNTNSDLRNILQYGVEDVHYELDEDGLLHRLNDRYMMDINKTGNVFMAYPEEGMPKNVWDYGKSQNTDAKTLMTLGLRFKEDDFTSSDDENALEKLRSAIRAVNEYSADVEQKLMNAQSVEELEAVMRDVASKFGTDPNIKAITNSSAQNPTPSSVYYDWLKSNGFLDED
ncbi:MAG: ABC transporter substrate-binding protein [Clostridiales bacterium]|nr:ABC transporter substrate-binding protein [Clostridiales bacterium]